MIKQLYGYFKWQTGKIALEKTWTGLEKGNLKREPDSPQRAVQNYIDLPFMSK